MAETATLRLDFSPLGVEAFGGDGDGGSQLLGEEGDAKLLEHPAVVVELGVDDALARVLGAAGLVALPVGFDFELSLLIAC